MEENKITTITTTIKINELINKVVNENPVNKCEFNNSLIYNFTNELLQNLGTQLEQQRETQQYKGGKKKQIKIKRKTIKRKVTKRKMTKRKITKINQKGGIIDPRLVIFFMTFFIVFVKGIKNVTDTDIIKRVKQVKDTSELFRNYYGTCSLNTMLFLKTIDLPTFEDLSVDIMANKRGLTDEQMSTYLNKDINIHSKWISLPGSEGDLEDVVEKVIERITDKLKNLRSNYGFEPTQSIITVMNYVKKSRRVGHSVVVWLTGNNELIIIEPQKIQRYGLELYTSESGEDKYMFNDKDIRRASLRKYIKDNIDVQNEFSDIDIFASMHIEMDETPGLYNLSRYNDKVIDTISRIREAEKNMSNKERIEF
jgi:hypothetical protein